MAYKQRTFAKCPGFVSRVDYKGQHWIQCRRGMRGPYVNREARDADYCAACCGDPKQCPYYKINQEAQHHERD